MSKRGLDIVQIFTQGNAVDLHRMDRLVYTRDDGRGKHRLGQNF